MILFLIFPLLVAVLYLGAARAAAALALVCVGPALFPGAFFAGAAASPETVAASLAQLPWTLFAVFAGINAAIGLVLERAGIRSRLLSGFRT